MAPISRLVSPLSLSLQRTRHSFQHITLERTVGSRIASFLPSFLSSAGFLPPPRLFLYPPLHSHSRTLRKPIALALNVLSFASRDDLELVWHLP